MRLPAVVLLFLVAFPALGLSGAAQEFMSIARELEPVHCEKRKLRRELALAEVEGEAERARALRARFGELDRDPKTARLEKRLADLERTMKLQPEELDAINRQQREAYHRCE